jgi:hypothetical protein
LPVSALAARPIAIKTNIRRAADLCRRRRSGTAASGKLHRDGGSFSRSSGYLRRVPAIPARFASETEWAAIVHGIARAQRPCNAEGRHDPTSRSLDDRRADMPSETEIKEIVARVSAQVMSEAKTNEKVFRIGDLSAHVTELAKGRDEAWSVTYSTTSAQLDASRINPVDQVAWSISYSTSKPTMTERGIEKKS